MIAQATENVSAANRFRQRRFAGFLRLLDRIPRPVSILDVGGTLEYWQALGFEASAEVRITLLNLFSFPKIPPCYESIVGDAADLSQFDDRQFDLVHSNSVIGHVGDYRRQRRMAQEIARVGKRFYVQTPNRHFPVDWRTLVPFFHWLPRPWQAAFISTMRMGRTRRIPDPVKAFEWAGLVRNLSQAEVRECFPEAVVLKERVFGVTKSFIIHSGFGHD